MYEITRFSDCDLSDRFFDSLKEDYSGFQSWFDRKAASGATAYVSRGDSGIQAFVYTKFEAEPVRN